MHGQNEETNNTQMKHLDKTSRSSGCIFHMYKRTRHVPLMRWGLLKHLTITCTYLKMLNGHMCPWMEICIGFARLMNISSKALILLGRFSNPFVSFPFKITICLDEHLLAVWKGDRFSLLKQSFLTREIEIWVMKNKIDDKEKVVW